MSTGGVVDETPRKGLVERLKENRAGLIVHSVVWLVFVWAMFAVATAMVVFNSGRSFTPPRVLDYPVFHTWWLSPNLIPSLVVVAFALFISPVLALRLSRPRLMAGAGLVVVGAFICAHLAGDQDTSFALVFVIATVVMALKYLSARRSTTVVLWSMLPVVGALKIARWIETEPSEKNTIGLFRASYPMLAALVIIIVFTVAE